MNNIKNDIWVSFFNRIYDVVTTEICKNKLDPQDIKTRKRYLYHGIIAITLLDGLNRSIGKEGISLSIGITITDRNCPAEYLELYKNLKKAKKILERNQLLQNSTIKDIMSNQSIDFLLLLRNISEKISHIPLYRQNYNNIMDFLDNSGLVYDSKERENKEIKENDIWKSFFNRCFEISEENIVSGYIKKEHIEDQEAYLFIGMPSITILDGLLRSQSLTEGIQFAQGFILKEMNCPNSHKELYNNLIYIKNRIKIGNFDNECIKELKLATLSNLEYRPNNLPKQNLISEIASAIRGIGIKISQMSFYKDKFNFTMEILEVICNT